MKPNNACIQAGVFQPDDQGNELRQEAIEAAVEVLRSDTLAPRLKRVLLRHLIWQITVADGKYATRFRSQGVREDQQLRRTVQHEHVYPIGQMIDALLRAETETQQRGILTKAIGCIVTTEEHDRLAEVIVDDDVWVRYREAEPPVIVFDTTNNQRAF